MIVAQALFLQQRPQILGTFSLRLSVWRLRPLLPMQRGGGLVTASPLLLGAPLEASSALPGLPPPAHTSEVALCYTAFCYSISGVICFLPGP